MADIQITDYQSLATGTWTAAFSAAIQDLTDSGGGRLVVPAGTYVSGTITLLSGVILHLEAGAVIHGSEKLEDYTSGEWGHNRDRTPWHLVTANGVSRCGLTGDGVIDGSGPAFWEQDPNQPGFEGGFIRAFKDRRPSPMVEFVECTGLFIEGVTLRNSPGWTLHLHDCSDVAVRGITIRNSPWGPNTDGIDITGSQHVVVENCDIQTGDDGICLKTTSDSREINDIQVRNCRVTSMCAALKLGCVESVRDMRNVVFEDCELRECSRMVAIYSYRGARIENIRITRISGDTKAPLILNRPIHIEARIDRPDESQPDLFVHDIATRKPWIRNVTIEDFSAETDGRVMIVGSDGIQVAQISIQGLRLKYPIVYNVERTADEAASRQFANSAPQARRASAAIVIDGAQSLEIDDVTIEWPDTETIAADWLPARRFENGSFRTFVADAQDIAKDMSVLWTRRSTAVHAHVPSSQIAFGISRRIDSDDSSA